MGSLLMKAPTAGKEMIELGKEPDILPAKAYFSIQMDLFVL